MESDKKIIIIGHKNPDTDSICSAIGYAEIKNRITNTNNYVARRAGEINGETEFVLQRFGIKVNMWIMSLLRSGIWRLGTPREFLRR